LYEKKVAVLSDPTRIAEDRCLSARFMRGESQRILQRKRIRTDGTTGVNGKFLMLKLGDKAPSFRLPSEEGKDVALKDFQGRRVLLFLFPKANTSG